VYTLAEWSGQYSRHERRPGNASRPLDPVHC
jgi:hypothetical protein